MDWFNFGLWMTFNPDSQHGIKRFIHGQVGNINIQATCDGDRWNRRHNTRGLCAIAKHVVFR